MGEVWKARDTRLDREVAIKTLPGTLARDPGRLARLEREAKLLATLNHHHVATIHGLELQDGASFLVMELVEGETLEDRLDRGALPVGEALTLALQLAQALEAAHARDIIHRDLKPANIKVTRDQRIKVLDFGIAKALAAPEGDDTRAELTGTGAIVGTPAWMSPEQARGEAVGVQSDIWAFGAVLYEMLTGIAPFKRKTSAETLASVLELQPDYSALPPDAPILARRLVQRCLEKDPSRRLQRMGDVRILVEEALASPGSEAPGAPSGSGASTLRARGRRTWAAIGLAAATLAGVALGLLASRSAAAPPAPALRVHASIPFVARPLRFNYGTRHLAISRDGSSVAYLSPTHVQIRRLDQKDAVAIPAARANNPFFSPDGKWVGMFAETGSLVKVPVQGGTPVALVVQTNRPAGADWGTDGTIAFATSEALYEVSADGGEPKVVAKPDRERKEVLYAWPQLLPGGRSMLFTAVSEDKDDPLQTVLLNRTTLERRTLLSGSSAVYIPSGHLVYVAGSTLNVVAFDAESGALAGTPVPFRDVEVAVSSDNGAASFAISNTGTLVTTRPPGGAARALEWIDRTGQRETLAVEPQAYGYVMVSPDGTRVAVERTTNGNRDIWILDLARLTQTRLTDGPTEDMIPVWSADSRRVFFSSGRSGNFEIYSQAADGASDARLEFAGPEIQVPSASTPDGTLLIVYDRFRDLGILDFSRPERLEPLLHGESDERLGQVSPDGRWIVYESDESGGQIDVIVRSFPNVNERRETVSINGGRYPRWGPKGSDELYYVAPDGAMMAVPIKLSPTLTLGRPQKLFDWQKVGTARSGQIYDVAPDGRFLTTRVVAPSADNTTNVSLILNWLAGLDGPRP